MAAPTLRAILTAIETTLLNANIGLRATNYSPGQVTPPQAIVTCPPVPNYYTGLTRRPILEVPVTVLVSDALNRIGQLQLADYADPDSPTSIAKAIAADDRLGGVVGQCEVTSFEPVGPEDVGGLGPYYGGRFIFRVTT